MTISNNLISIKESLPADIVLVAVSKHKSNNAIMEAYCAGQKIFGENKVQELVEKYAELPKDIEWHMIGHLQTNKVKHIALFVHLIHSVDSLSLLKEIDKRAFQNNRIIDCLVQVHIAKEESKFGFSVEQIPWVISEAKSLENIRIRGLMGIATMTENTQQIEKEFHLLKNLFDAVKTDQINILSMGMSNDYPLAILHGSNMIRVGSSIFGLR